MSRCITILEDDLRRVAEMRACLDEAVPGAEVVFFDRAAEMIAWLADHLDRTCLICLDHDLPLRRRDDGTLDDFGTGREVADYLATRPRACPVIIHTSNAPAGIGICAALKDAGWRYARVYPCADLEWIRTDWLEQLKRLVRE